MLVWVFLPWAFPAFAGEPASVVFEGDGERMEVPAAGLSGITLSETGQGLADLQFRLGPEPALQFEELTGRLVGQSLRLSICGKILAEPTVMLPIEGGQVSVKGGTEYMGEIYLALTTAGTCPDGGS